MIDVHFEDLPKLGGWEAKETCIQAIRKDGTKVHLIYDRRINRTRRPISDNRYIILPGVSRQCHKVSIINENGACDVVKEHGRG